MSLVPPLSSVRASLSRHRVGAYAIVAIVLGATAGCALMPAPARVGAQTSTLAPATSPGPDLGPSPDRGDGIGNYRLAAGDAIRITVFQNPDMTLETRVSENGDISYPLVGVIGIGGLDIGKAESKIATALRTGGFLRQPQVNIALVRILGNKISVLGQVNKPGSYPLETFNVRVSQLIADAGGLAPGGADQLILTGTRDGRPFRRLIDIDALYRLDQGDQDIPVVGGDAVYVPRAPTFYIYGEVTRPGTYRIDRNMTFRQALATGGGLTGRGTERRLRVVRRNAEGVPEKMAADLNDPVQPDDVIYVNESIF